MEAVSWLVGLSSVSIVGVIGLLTVLLVLWCILPFAVFGLKKRVDAATIELQNANRLLRSIERQLASRSEEPDSDKFII